MYWKDSTPREQLELARHFREGSLEDISDVRKARVCEVWGLEPNADFYNSEEFAELMRGYGQ